MDELRILDVVHDHLAVKAAREFGRDERLQLSLRRAARETRCDEDRLVAGRDPVPLELRHDGGDRVLAGIVRRAGNRQRRRLDHDRRACPAPCLRLERVACEREPQRVAHRSADVGDRFCGRRRAEDDGVVGRACHDEPSPREQRNARHGADDRANRLADAPRCSGGSLRPDLLRCAPLDSKS